MSAFAPVGIIATGGQGELTVRGQGNGIEIEGAVRERAQFPARGHVPKAQHLTFAGHNEFAIGGKGYGIGGFCVAAEGAQLAARGHVPKPQRIV